MIATCNNCEAKFRVDDAKIGPRGVKVKCSRCNTTFIVRLEVNAGAPEPEFAVGAAPFRTPFPLEPTPMSLRMQGAEFPVEFTPANEPSALAPPLPGPPPLRREAERFDLGEPEPFAIPPPRPLLPSESEALPTHRELAPIELVMPETPFAKTGSSSLFELADSAAGPALALDLGGSEPSPAPQDLFETSFSSPLSPAPFADEPTRPMDAPLPDPLAGLPTFDQPAEEQPQFSGGLSQEGVVTKNIDVTALREQMRAHQPVASIELARPQIHEKVTKPQIMAPPRDSSRQTNRLVALMSSVALVLVITALAIAYRAGGAQGLRTHALPSPLSIDRLSIIPYATHEGGRVWVLRGQVRNRSADAHHFHVTVDGANQAVSAPAGVGLDPLALYDRGEVKTIGQAKTELAPKESAEFTIALGAGDVSQPDVLTAHAVVEF